MKKVVIYLRFNRYDTYIDYHLNILKKYAEDNKYVIKNTFIDNGYSGSNFNRPEYQNMMDYIKNNKIDIVLTTNLTRITRNTKDLEMFLNKLQLYNIKLKTIDTSEEIISLFKNYMT